MAATHYQLADLHALIVAILVAHDTAPANAEVVARALVAAEHRVVNLVGESGALQQLRRQIASIAPLIGEAMRRITNEESVSSLFN